MKTDGVAAGIQACSAPGITRQGAKSLLLRILKYLLTRSRLLLGPLVRQSRVASGLGRHGAGAEGGTKPSLEFPPSALPKDDSDW